MWGYGNAVFGIFDIRMGFFRPYKIRTSLTKHGLKNTTGPRKLENTFSGVIMRRKDFLS
jgi:hypothetical protein